MAQDELDHLRTILAKVHEKPRTGIRTIVQRIAKGFFTTPKKVIVERIQNEPPKSKKDIASKDAA